MKFKRRRELPRTKIEIIPMIDTIFFLLVFFMLSSLSLARLNGLPVDLPQASTAPAQANADVTLTIDRNGKLFVDKTPTTWPQLQTALLRGVQNKGGLERASLLINADERVAHGIVVRAIDIARDIGITRYGIATSPEQTLKIAPR